MAQSVYPNPRKNLLVIKKQKDTSRLISYPQKIFLDFELIAGPVPYLQLLVSFVSVQQQS